MRTKIISLILTAGLMLISAACRRDSSTAEKVIKSVKAGTTTVTLSSASGEIKSDENALTLSFTDASGSPVNIPAASLKFYMPAMGSMAEMNDVAELTTTETPGKFRALVSIEVAGSWEAMITFQGSHGTEQTTMNVTAK